MALFQLNNRTARRNILYTTIVVALFGAQFWLWPYIGVLAQRWQEGQAQDKQLLKLRQKISDVEKKFSNDQSSLDQLSTVAPSDKQIAQFIERLESVAQSRGVTIQIQAINEEQPKKVRPMIFVLQAQGRPAALLSYIAALEHLPELVTIRSWKLSPVNTANNNPPQATGSYVLSMNVIFYLQSSLKLP